MEQAEIYSCALRRVTRETPTSNQTRLTAPGVSTACTLRGTTLIKQVINMLTQNWIFLSTYLYRSTYMESNKIGFYILLFFLMIFQNLAEIIKKEKDKNNVTVAKTLFTVVKPSLKPLQRAKKYMV